jgi:hypothetical protein
MVSKMDIKKNYPRKNSFTIVKYMVANYNSISNIIAIRNIKSIQ